MRKELCGDIRLVIPSRNRAQFLMHRVCNTLSQVGYLKPDLYVRDDDPQLELYKAYAEQYGANLILQPSEGCFGVSQAYDMLINDSIAMGYKRLLILDDDMDFKIWNPIPNAKPDILRITGDPLTEMLNQFADVLRPELPAGCMIPIFARAQPLIISYGAPLMWCYAFYLPHFAAHPEHRYYKGKEIEARCDANLALQLLTQGWLTFYYNRLIIPGEAPNPGGCSTYRTLAVEEQSTDYLLEHYPSLVREKIKYGWGADQPNVKRRSVTVYWKKAFNEDLFIEHFGVSSVHVRNKALAESEAAYTAFVEELRK